jgi:hypothetical protein
VNAHDQNERGSALLSSLVLLFVITLLGLALFDLGVLENRLAATSHTNAQAFEIAQAGLERAIARLALTVTRERAATPACGPATPPCFDWANGEQALGIPPLGLCTGPCSDTFVTANPLYLGDRNFSGGTFTVSFSLVQPGVLLGVDLTGCPLTPGGPYCAAFIFVRSTGEAGATTGGTVVGYRPSRTVQALIGMAPLSVPPPAAWPPPPVVIRVSPFWLECRAGANALLPPTPTGACGY